MAQQYLSLAENISLQTHVSFFHVNACNPLMQKPLYQKGQSCISQIETIFLKLEHWMIYLKDPYFVKFTLALFWQ